MIDLKGNDLLYAHTNGTKWTDLLTQMTMEKDSSSLDPFDDNRIKRSARPNCQLSQNVVLRIFILFRLHCRPTESS